MSFSTPTSRRSGILGFIDKLQEDSFRRQARKKRISMNVFTVFTQQFAAMLEAGLPILSCIEALKDQTNDPVFRIILNEVRQSIASGKNLSEAVREFPNAFPNFFCSMIEAGEASGALPKVAADVADYYTDSSKLIKKVKSAMTYPACVIALAIALVNVLIIFVIPVFTEMFAGFGAELPTPTRLLIALSDFMNNNIIYLVAGSVIVFFSTVRFIKTPNGRIIKDRVLHKLPVVGKIVHQVAIARFCRTYAIMMQAGVPIMKTIDITSAASDNTYVESACRQMTRHVNEGGQISEVISTHKYFPSTVSHMAKAGEKIGDSEGMMQRAADYYDVEVNNAVGTLTSLIEPLLIVILGVVIGSIVMAMFLPVFQLSSIAGA